MDASSVALEDAGQPTPDLVRTKSTLLEASEHSGPSPKRIRSGIPMAFSNEQFEGKLLLFVRDPSIPPAAKAPGNRYWELQVQGRFKTHVENLYMGMELSEGIGKMGFFFRSVANTTVAFTKTYEPDIHFSFGAVKDELIELPHLVTPMFKAVDAFAETVDGTEAPPVLGSDLLATHKAPKSERPSAVRLDATYTFAVYSTMLDAHSWRVRGCALSQTPTRLVSPTASAPRTSPPRTGRLPRALLLTGDPHDH